MGSYLSYSCGEFTLYEQLCSAGRVRVLTSPTVVVSLLSMSSSALRGEYGLTSPTVVVSLLSMSSSALRGEYGFLPLLQLW